MMVKRKQKTRHAFPEKPARRSERERESLEESSDEEGDTSSTDSEEDAPFRERGDALFNNADPPEGGRWNNADDPDVTPPQPTFSPTRPPGPQLPPAAPYAALQLFKLFFTNSILQTIARNTNDHGSSNPGACDPWVDLTPRDLCSFVSLVVYMGIVKCPALADYWREGKLHGLPFPRRVMTSAKFLRIYRTLHLSSPAAEAANEQRRGTAAFDPLCRIKPLYQEMRDACMRNYHPSQEITIEELTLASHPHAELKPVRWGCNIFGLVDSRSRYIWDFVICKGKFQGSSGQGLGYDSVMELIDTRSLGTGYKLFVNHFFTSPALFRHLLQRGILACGSVHANRAGVPKTPQNRLDSESPRGSLRWIRRDSLLFVQWRDAGDVFVCSSMHAAHAEDARQRRVGGEDGRRLLKDVSVPPAVKEYYLSAAASGLSGVPAESCKIPHETTKWYKMLFYHFVDIAIANAFLLHGDVAESNGERPLQRREFRERLAEQLAEAGCPPTVSDPPPPPPPRGAHHRPVHISGHSTDGRLKCRQCHAKTPVKCSSCDVPLCFVPGRDCYNEWHVAKSL